MLKFVCAAMASFVLCACANRGVVDRQAALVSCQAVGISERDPQFATCMQAQIQGRRESQIERAYQGAKNIIPNERMTPHADVQIY